MNDNTRLFTSECVADGHPDKMCDAISDAILDEALRQDPLSRVAIESAVKGDQVMVFGEMTTNAEIDISKVVRNTLTDIGYGDPQWGFDPWKVKQFHNISEQSREIGAGVDGEDGNTGAGDQGHMFGYAVKETPEMMPLPLMLAREITLAHKDYRISHAPAWKLGPDAKSQVTVRYADSGEPIEIDTIVLSTLHEEVYRNNYGFLHAELRDIIREAMSQYSHLLTNNTKFIINPAGFWHVGGPIADAGLTGRKIIVDTYGGAARHGGGAFCVDGNTEYLTPTGWKRIAEYEDGEMVGQYEDGSLSFVYPSEFINQPASEMYHLTMPNAVDQVLSPGHKFVYMTSKGNINEKPFYELMDEHNKATRGSHARVITSFYHEGGDGVDLTDDELRLMVAAIADGSYPKEGRNICRFRLKKSRKINRLRDIIQRIGLDAVDRTLDDGFTYITVEVPRRDYEYGDYYWSCNRDQMEVISEEVVHWDGDPEKHIYRTTDKASADYIQYAWTSVYGKRVSIHIDDRVGQVMPSGHIRKSKCYELTRLKHSLVGLRSKSHKADIQKVDVINDRQYCFTVPSGMLIFRRNNKIFITGNSGKDPTKVDRSAAYAARRLAKIICDRYDRHRTEVQVSYAIGMPDPVSVHVYGMHEQQIREVIEDVGIDLTPRGIIKQLDLLRPIYTETASRGHFGHLHYPWEQIT